MEMALADHCRREAVDCQREAQRAIEEPDVNYWLQLAAKWFELAEAARHSNKRYRGF